MLFYDTTKILVLGLSLGLGAGACGSDGGDDDDGLGESGLPNDDNAEESGGEEGEMTGSVGPEDGPTFFECGESGECKATEEYCLLSITNGVESAQECIPMPSECVTAPSCDCVQEDAPEHSANCIDGVIACDGSASNGALEFRVSCEKSL